MKLADFLRYLERPAIVKLKNESNKIICFTLTDSEGIEPYLNREIISWSIPDLTLECQNIKADLCITLFNKKNGELCGLRCIPNEVKDDQEYPGTTKSGIAPELLYNGADH